MTPVFPRAYRGSRVWCVTSAARVRTSSPNAKRGCVVGFRTVGDPRARVAGTSAARSTRFSGSPGAASGPRRAVLLHEPVLDEQLLEPLDPYRVVAQPIVVGKRLARAATHVDVPHARRAHRERQRERLGFPRRVKEHPFRFGDDPTVPVLAAEIGVRCVGHCALPAARGNPVPIIESRVTSAASASSRKPSVPAGRRGSTR